MHITVDIDGMSCENCVKHAREALEGLQGVTNAAVNLEAKRAEVDADTDPGDEAIRRALDEEGFEATTIART